MKSPIRNLFLGAALLAAAAAPASAQTNVSISVGQPGFYGRLDIGDFGPPPVVYAQPVVVREVRHVRVEPVYLRVPSTHRQNWSRYCGRYDACARPVMFVRDDWYQNTYAPRYRERHGHGGGHHKERGHGNGHGNGHGKGHGHGH
jgi:hypothetical protein